MNISAQGGFPLNLETGCYHLISGDGNTMDWWWSGVVVSALASINKVNLRQAR